MNFNVFSFFELLLVFKKLYIHFTCPIGNYFEIGFEIYLNKALHLLCLICNFLIGKGAEKVRMKSAEQVRKRSAYVVRCTPYVYKTLVALHVFHFY